MVNNYAYEKNNYENALEKVLDYLNLKKGNGNITITLEKLLNIPLSEQQSELKKKNSNTKSKHIQDPYHEAKGNVVFIEHRKEEKGNKKIGITYANEEKGSSKGKDLEKKPIYRLPDIEIELKQTSQGSFTLIGCIPVWCG